MPTNLVGLQLEPEDKTNDQQSQLFEINYVLEGLNNQNGIVR